MELQQLAVQIREEVGKGPGRRTRSAGMVPAVLYGGDGANHRLTLNTKLFNAVLHGKQGEHALVQLEVEGNPSLSGPAMVKEVQHHPIRGHVMHADFMRIRLDEKIHTLTSVVLVGRSKGVVEGGVLDHQLREIEIECFALDVPDSIQIDVTELGIGDSIHVREITPPKGVDFITPGDRAVAAVQAPRVETAAVEEVAVEAVAADAAKPEAGDKKKE